MALRSFRELTVWQASMDLVVQSYTLTQDLPDHEKYGLTSQVRRAVVSIPANIAEGYGRQHRGDYVRFLSIASGSLAETETLLLLALRLNYITREQLIPIWKQTQDVGKMLRGLIAALRKTEPATTNNDAQTREP